MPETIDVQLGYWVGGAYGATEGSYKLTAALIASNIAALKAAEKELADREFAKSIPPGTRVRYKLIGSGWRYGTVAASDAPYYPGGDNRIVGNVRSADRVWAHWDGDTNPFASYRMRAHVEVVR